MENEFWEELVTHLDGMKANAMRLCKNEADAADLLQNTLCKVLKRSDKFEMGTNMKAWLYTVMRNQFINEYRRNKRLAEILAENNRLMEQKNSKSQAEFQAVGQDEYEHLLALLKENLNEDYFEVLILVDVFDKAYREAAEILDTPIGTIMSRLHRARKICRQLLLEEYDRDMLREALQDRTIEKYEKALEAA